MLIREEGLHASHALYGVLCIAVMTRRKILDKPKDYGRSILLTIPDCLCQVFCLSLGPHSKTVIGPRLLIKFQGNGGDQLCPRLTRVPYRLNSTRVIEPYAEQSPSYSGLCWSGSLISYVFGTPHGIYFRLLFVYSSNHVVLSRRWARQVSHTRVSMGRNISFALPLLPSMNDNPTFYSVYT